jgi:predicted nucleotidyltransferase
MRLDPGISKSRDLIERIAGVLGYRVDVVTERALLPGLRDAALREAVPL